MHSNMFNLLQTRVSSVELSVVFSVEKMSVEKNMTLNSTINNTKFFLKNNVLPQSYKGYSEIIVDGKTLTTTNLLILRKLQLVRKKAQLSSSRAL